MLSSNASSSYKLEGGMEGLITLAGLNEIFNSIHIVKEKQFIRMPWRRNMLPDTIEI
jgi:hypothetical protein